MLPTLRRTDVVKQYTKKTLASNIVRIMKNHLGRHNAITQSDLFRELYGDPGSYSDMEVYILWQRVKEMLHFLRKNTTCFVISGGSSRQPTYFIPVDKQDADVYRKRQAKIVRQAINLMNQAYIAVDEKFYEKLQGNIVLPHKGKPLLV